MSWLGGGSAIVNRSLIYLGVDVERGGRREGLFEVHLIL